MDTIILVKRVYQVFIGCKNYEISARMPASTTIGHHNAYSEASDIVGQPHPLHWHLGKVIPRFCDADVPLEGAIIICVHCLCIVSWCNTQKEHKYLFVNE